MCALKRVLMALTVAASLGAAGMAQSESISGNPGPSGVGMIVDALVLRPAGFVATLIGGVAYVVSLPFSVAGGNTQQAWNTLVAQPAQFTFNRPLGDTTFSNGY
jgi:hypothetical protein